MNRRMPLMIDPTWVGGIAGMLGALLVASLSLGQVPDVSDAVRDAAQDANQTAQDAAKSATDTASDATKTATDTARDATKSATETADDEAKKATDTAKSATDTARDATKSATDTARDATKSAKDSARDASKNATGTARDAAKNANRTGRNAAKSATDTARDATRSATDTARDVTKSTTEATKSATETARDATRSATETVRDVTKSATDATRDATRSATDATRDAARATTEATRDAAREATDTARDVTDSTREAAQDVRDTARDASRNARDAARTTPQDVREGARDINRDVRDTVDDVRSTARDASQSVIDQTRRSVGADANIRSRTSMNTSNLRSADLGLWFDRSVRDGLVIADVATDAALAQVGFVEGDRIVSVNGRTITTEQDFLRLVMAENVRQPMNVIVMRGDQRETLVLDPVVIRERYTTVRTDPLERFGIILDDRVTDRLLVWRVIPRSPAFYAGIRAGDEITMFAGQRIADPVKFVQIVERTDPGLIPVQVSRSGRVREVEVDYPQYQVSERHSTYRQDLDAGTRIETQTDATRGRGQLNTDVDANVTTPGGTVRGRTNASGQLDTQLPPVPDSADAPASQPRTNQPTYNGSGSSYQRRGIFRRGR